MPTRGAWRRGMTGQGDLDELRSALLAGLEGLAEALLGPPSIRKPRTWRWGSKGSLCLELHGRKRGAWIDHETGQGGGPFHLVQHARSCSMADAIDWSRHWAGLPENERRTTAAPVRNRTSGADAEEAADQTRRITAARSLWARSTPIAGTVAARYLTDARAIPAPSTGWPDAVRFHAPTCSLILAATDATGAVQAVQRVHLTPEGRKAEGTARPAGEGDQRRPGRRGGAAARRSDRPATAGRGAGNRPVHLGCDRTRDMDHARQLGEGRAADRPHGGDRAG